MGEIAKYIYARDVYYDVQREKKVEELIEEQKNTKKFDLEKCN